MTASPYDIVAYRPAASSELRATTTSFCIDEALAGQAAENGIDRPFGDDQIGERFEVLDDREAVEWAGRDGQQNREVEAASPELFLPGFDRHTL